MCGISYHQQAVVAASQGAAIAERYAKENANLVLVARSTDELKEVLAFSKSACYIGCPEMLIVSAMTSACST